MTPLVRDHQCEGRTERKPEPFRCRRTDSRFGEIDSVGLPQPIDELHLICAECRHDLAPRAMWFRLEQLGRLHPEPGGRFHGPHEESSEPVVREGTLGIRAISDGRGDSLIEHRQVRTRGRVQVVQAQCHWPGICRRSPRELLFVEPCNKRVGVIGDLLELFS